MKENVVITIIYEIRCTRQYLCASGFFSFCGFLVTGIRSEKVDKNFFSNESITIFLSCNEVQEKEETGVYLTVGNENASNCSIVADILAELVTRSLIDEKTERVLTTIRSFYMNHNLWLHEYNIQQYFCLKDEIPEIIKTYIEISSKLYDVAGQNEENPYIWYAFFHSMRRIQTLSNYYNKTILFDNNHINKDIDRLINKYPEFLSFYVLKGFLNAASNKIEEAEKSLKEVIDNKLNTYTCLNPYISEISYFIGRLNEHSLSNDRDARTFYSLSYLRDHDNYRALYKLARFNQNRGKETEAWELYSKIESQLDFIAKQKYLQPRESEYLFKVVFCKWKISTGSKYASENKALMDKLLNLSEEGINSQQFYDDFYRELSGKYRSFVMERLKLQQKKMN